MKSIQNNFFSLQAQKYDFCFVATLEYYDHMCQEFTVGTCRKGASSEFDHYTKLKDYCLSIMCPRFVYRDSFVLSVIGKRVT